jgi:hypothetical protein
MATNLKQKRKKLYFDLTFNRATTNVITLCTQFTATSPSSERYGGLLDALIAAQGGTAAEQKAKLAVSAWFQPNTQVLSNATAAGTNRDFTVDFVSPKANAVNVTATPLPYLTGSAGGGLTVVALLAGHEAIYSITVGQTRHFSVRVRRTAAAGVSVSGTLYVQRQNTLEV